MMRLRNDVPSHRFGSTDSGHALFTDASAQVQSEAPAYVWPLNPWGGYPFRRAEA